MSESDAASRYGPSVHPETAAIGKEMQTAGVENKAVSGPEVSSPSHTPTVATNEPTARGQALGGHTQPGHPSAGYDSAAGRYGPTHTPEAPATEPPKEPGN